MVTEYQYTNIRRVLDNLVEHPLLRDLTLEQAVRHTIRFISLHGYSKLYQDKIAFVDIHDFRGLLPCDLISIVQVKEKGTEICLRSMTDSFAKGIEPHPKPVHDDKPDIHGEIRPWYIPPVREHLEEPSFKTQGRIIYTSFPEGCVEVAYEAIPVDEDGFPLLIDNETYLAALEAYIKKQIFTVKFDTGKISAGVLQNAKQDYAMLSGQLMSEFTTPSYSEVESFTRYYNSLLPRVREFDKGFRDLGSREWLRRH